MSAVKKIMYTLNLVAQFLVLLGALSIGVLGMYRRDPLEGLFSSSVLPYIQSCIGLSALFLIIMRFL
jgi:uncharacterized membrane protein YuzA (DUF378 family)